MEIIFATLAWFRVWKVYGKCLENIAEKVNVASLK